MRGLDELGMDQQSRAGCQMAVDLCEASCSTSFCRSCIVTLGGSSLGSRCGCIAVCSGLLGGCSRGISLLLSSFPTDSHQSRLFLSNKKPMVRLH